MPSAAPCRLPDAALLKAYQRDGGYVDCYSTEVAAAMSFERFVEAFYTTWVFKVERAILSWAMSLPSTDEDAKRLASGDGDKFAAWHVEARAANQLLLCAVDRRTRSWLMVEPAAGGTRLYFGSAVVPVRNRQTGTTGMGTAYRALLGFHRLYSKILLNAARTKSAPDW